MTTVETTTTWELREGLEDHTLDMFRPTSGQWTGWGWIHTRECHEAHRQAAPLVDPWWLNDIPFALAEVVLEKVNRTVGNIGYDDNKIGLCQNCCIRHVSS